MAETLSAPLAFREAITRLRQRYGSPAPPISRDPFHLVLWEQVGYLADDDRRTAAFEALRDRVGLEPAAIFRAPMTTLSAVTRIGGAIAFEDRARRLARSAAMVLDDWDGDLGTALRQPAPAARRALMRFPMIGEPGADKILLFARAHRAFAVDSNGLRVLQRLGYGRELKSYTAAYRSVLEAIADQLPADYDALIAAHHLLRQHGRSLCRRADPECAECPLRSGCAFGRR
jgi:endonuclease III